MTRKPRSTGSRVPRSGQPANAATAALAENLRSLQAEVEDLRDLYENAPNAYLLLDTDGRILRVNRRVTEILGYAASELVGADLHSFMADTPAGKARGQEVSRKHLAGAAVAGWELEMRHNDGRPLWIKLWLEPCRAADGTVGAARAIFLDITERVLADQRTRLQAQTLYLQEEIKAHYDFEQIVGQSPALLEVLANVRRVALTDASLLVTGETGTGKELIARAIHFSSRRQDRPLIKVNCAALPAGLVESELFGHEKGAFSGAVAKRLGRFELADGGTIFLDEIGELPREAQAKLLRVLQERELDRVGGTAPVKVDVRVIAATNRSPFQMVQEKTFRDDLYFRLNVFPIHLPPLRARRDDIPLLAQFLVRKFAQRIGKHLEGIAEATLRRLEEYPWPGNIRELENVLERAVILAAGPILEMAPDLLSTPAAPPPAAPPVPGPAATPPQPTLEAAEHAYILTVLEQTNWVIAGQRGAAKILGLHPSTLANRMKKLGITRATHQIR
jgi:PAS domain S-box-containing protein